MRCIFCLTRFCQFTYTHTIIRWRHIRLFAVCWCWSLLLPFATTVSHPLVPDHYRLLLSDAGCSFQLLFDAVGRSLLCVTACLLSFILMLVSGYSCCRLLLSTSNSYFVCCHMLLVPFVAVDIAFLLLFGTVRSWRRLLLSSTRSRSLLLVAVGYPFLLPFDNVGCPFLLSFDVSGCSFL